MTIPLLPPPVCKTGTRPHKRTSASAFHSEPPDADDPLLGFAPYVHAAPRRNSITPERQRAFVAALAASGVVTQAAREIGASLEALYKLRHRKGAEGFSAAWDMALDRGVARLEDCALERAIQGEERLFLNRAGEVVARWTRYDTALITFLLRQRRSERFAASQHFSSLRPGHPVYERLKREWERERDLADERAAAANEDFLRRLDRRLAAKRNEAISAGLMRLDDEGRGHWTDPELGGEADDTPPD